MMLILNYYLILAFLVGYLGAVKFRCDYSYSRVGWFKYHKIPATWHDARLRCHYEGAVLASPVSTEIRAVMKNTIEDIDIFTGINSNIAPGVYRSLEGIPLETITHSWADNEPDNKNNNERCISFNSEGKFSDVSCEEPRPYMCFRPNSIKDVTACGTPDKEYVFEKKTDKCYKFHTTPQTFERSDLICAAEGGHLAVINSKVEFDVIRNIFSKKPADKIIGANNTNVAFIGFYNLDGEWTTIHGQSLKDAGFDKFFPGEPNNGTAEYCGSVFRNGYLNDLSCDKHFAFICEKQINYPPVCDSDAFNEASTYSPVSRVTE